LVIVKIQGGLGNQLFQYATGKAIALRNDFPLKLDLEWYHRNSDRSFMLKRFNAQVDIASASEILKLKGANDNMFLKGLRKLKLLRPAIMEDGPGGFNASLMNVKKPIYLNGYWQSPKYFESIANVLRADFTIRSLNPSAEAYRKIIESGNSVALHVRRGDYVTNHAANSFHGVLPLTYYRRALDRLRLILPAFNLFVFSDDVKFARDAFSDDSNIHFVAGNTDEEDLVLFSLCHHQITANSSFSWWGAWLNKNTEKKVFAPQQWFVDPGKNATSQNLIPPTWIRI
jgi:hypothetical protein